MRKHLAFSSICVSVALGLFMPFAHCSIHSLAPENYKRFFQTSSSYVGAKFKGGEEDPIVPNPPYDLRGLADERKPYPAFAHEWNDLMEGKDKHGYLLIHGLSISSTKRVLSMYFDPNWINTLSPKDIFNLALFAVFDLRNALSCSIFNMDYPASWYPGGIIVRMPLQNLYAAGITDQYVPMESNQDTQKSFRKRFAHKNPLPADLMERYEEEARKFVKENHPSLKLGTFAYNSAVAKEISRLTSDNSTVAYGPKSSIGKPDEYEPDKSLNYIAGGTAKGLIYSEVAGFIKTESPSGPASLEIIGFWIRKGGKYPFCNEGELTPPDQALPSEQKKRILEDINNDCINKIKAWAQQTGLPLVDVNDDEFDSPEKREKNRELFRNIYFHSLEHI